jgi:hypothetical protein
MPRVWEMLYSLLINPIWQFIGVAAPAIAGLIAWIRSPNRDPRWLYVGFGLTVLFCGVLLGSFLERQASNTLSSPTVVIDAPTSAPAQAVVQTVEVPVTVETFATVLQTVEVPVTVVQAVEVPVTVVQLVEVTPVGPTATSPPAPAPMPMLGEGDTVDQGGAQWTLLEARTRSNGIALQFQFTNRSGEDLLLQFNGSDITAKDQDGNVLRVDEFRCNVGIVCIPGANDMVGSGNTFGIFFRLVFNPVCDGSQVITITTKNVSRIGSSTWQVPIRC